VSQNYIPRVTHVIAQDANDAFFKARKDRVDMISVEWLLECVHQQCAVPLRPHHYLHLTTATLSSVPDVCKYGDMYVPCMTQCFWLMQALEAFSRLRCVAGALALKEGYTSSSQWLLCRYFEDVGAIDVKAILNNHAHVEAAYVERLAESAAADMAEEPILGHAHAAVDALHRFSGRLVHWSIPACQTVSNETKCVLGPLGKLRSCMQAGGEAFCERHPVCSRQRAGRQRLAGWHLLPVSRLSCQRAHGHALQ
jgi:hypothetical protein